jgi:hypothetical protein
MGRRNYWHVYNQMRRHYLDTGVAQQRVDLLAEFSDMEPAEVDEGIAEFELAIGIRMRGVDLNGYKKA